MTHDENDACGIWRIETKRDVPRFWKIDDEKQLARMLRLTGASAHIRLGDAPYEIDAPLTADEANALADECGYVDIVTDVDLSELTDIDIEATNDLMEERIVCDYAFVLADISYATPDKKPVKIRTGFVIDNMDVPRTTDELLDEIEHGDAFLVKNS